MKMTNIRAEQMAKDAQFTEAKIVKVSGDPRAGWIVERAGDGGGCIGISGDSPIEPRAGMTARYYGKGRGAGCTVRGVVIDGVVVRYKTAAEHEAQWLKECEDREIKQREAAEKNRDDVDRRVADLPSVFRARIERFRAKNPDFRWESEDYELFCLEQAVAIADALKTPEAVKVFHDKTPKDPRSVVPGFDDGHSGNTFNGACGLAVAYLEGREL